MDGPQLIRSLRPLLIGQNPLERERIHQQMRLLSRLVSYRTIGAVDTALWDLVGKIAGLPVHALMGTRRRAILGYASSQQLPDPVAYADQAQEFKASGWHAYKIHPPREPEKDIAVYAIVEFHNQTQIVPFGPGAEHKKFGDFERATRRRTCYGEERLGGPYTGPSGHAEAAVR